jgi:hypothetical protein
MNDGSIARFEGIHCVLTIRRAADGVVVVTLEGHDVGELGDAPFRELEKDFVSGRTLQLFIDARNAKTASMSVSGEWARWLQRHCEQFRQISILTRSQFIAMSAGVVQRVADLGERMRLYTDPAAFDAAVAEAQAAAVVATTKVQRFEGAHCLITVDRPAAGVLLVTFDGHDVGEHGNGPFLAMESHLATGEKAQLFIDARNGKAASIDVSGAWAKWLMTHRDRFLHISMLTGSRFIELSASFVRQFADLGETMRLYSDSASFEQSLAGAITAEPPR